MTTFESNNTGYSKVSLWDSLDTPIKIRTPFQQYLDYWATLFTSSPEIAEADGLESSPEFFSRETGKLNHLAIGKHWKHLTSLTPEELSAQSFSYSIPSTQLFLDNLYSAFFLSLKQVARRQVASTDTKEYRMFLKGTNYARLVRLTEHCRFTPVKKTRVSTWLDVTSWDYRHDKQEYIIAEETGAELFQDALGRYWKLDLILRKLPSGATAWWERTTTGFSPSPDRFGIFAPVGSLPAELEHISFESFKEACLRNLTDPTRRTVYYQEGAKWVRFQAQLTGYVEPRYLEAITSVHNAKFTAFVPDMRYTEEGELGLSYLASRCNETLPFSTMIDMPVGEPRVGVPAVRRERTQAPEGAVPQGPPPS